MRSKDKRTQAGGKGGGSAYDPQIGTAAAETAATAQKAEAFSENYTNTVITPLIKSMVTQSADSQANQDKLFGINYDQMSTALDRYKQYGIPAENRYYDMVSKYSAPAYQEEQAGLALGDVRTAETGQATQLNDRLRSLGIDPTSPAAMSAMSDRAVMNAATEAGAANRARSEARNLGMTLTSDAANFGRGGTSQTLAFGNAASGNTNSAASISQSAVGAGVQGATTELAGLNTAMQGYTANLDAYSKLGAADIQANAQAGSGLGSFLGSALGMFSGGSTPWIFASDVRLKTDIKKVGTRPDGINIYDFRYKGNDRQYRGVLAHEVEKVIPAAVGVDQHGYKTVNYSMLR